MAKVVSEAGDTNDERRHITRGRRNSSCTVGHSIEKHKSLLDFAGAWKGSNSDLDEIFSRILARRHAEKARRLRL